MAAGLGFFEFAESRMSWPMGGKCLVGRSRGGEVLGEVSSRHFITSRANATADNANALSLYPNPTSEQLNNGPLTSGTHLSIYSLHGQKIRTCTADEEFTSVDVSDLPAGLWLLRIESPAQPAVFRSFLKQ